jgi:hypothetical protein
MYKKILYMSEKRKKGKEEKKLPSAEGYRPFINLDPCTVACI